MRAGSLWEFYLLGKDRTIEQMDLKKAFLLNEEVFNVREGLTGFSEFEKTRFLELKTYKIKQEKT